jgi:integrase
MKTTRDIINANKKLAAQSNTLCEVVTPPNGKELTIQSILYKCRNHSQDLFIICSLQLKYALRISEVLNIRFSDIDFQGRCIIRGLKNSNNRIIYLSEFERFKNIKNNTTNYVFYHINRFYVYREYKKMGIYEQLKDNSNVSVTHYNRYLSQATLQDNTENLEIKQQLLGHKSNKNTHRYHNKMK